MTLSQVSRPGIVIANRRVIEGYSELPNAVDMALNLLPASSCASTLIHTSEPRVITQIANWSLR